MATVVGYSVQGVSGACGQGGDTRPNKARSQPALADYLPSGEGS